MEVEEEGGDSEVESPPFTSLLLPTNIVAWHEVFPDECKTTEPMHPELGLAYTLHRQHFQESERLFSSFKRHMPILSITETAKRPVILRHLQLHFPTVQLSRSPTADAPLWFAVMLRTPARPIVSLRESVMLEIRHTSSLIYPGFTDCLASQVPSPLADLSMPPGSLLCLQTDSSVVNLDVQVVLYLSDVYS